MVDKAQAPRIKEQYKDNAAAVKKNIVEKNKLRNEEIVDRTSEELEIDEEYYANPNGSCGCGCTCGYCF